MPWTEPQYTPQQVNRAGREVAKYYAGDEDLNDIASDGIDDYLEIVNNFRISHSYPLTIFQQYLLASACRFDEDALVAQRIKRLSSIWQKLARFPSMRLTQMQDIGGCRAVLDTMDRTTELVRFYLTESRIKHKPESMDDYIEYPKDSGYRGVHLIYRYLSDKSRTAYNGLKIEIQIRSRYQHAWATAVETVGTFVEQALKSSQGEDAWLRFFALMGSVIAMREKAPLVPNTPSSRAGLHYELLALEKRLNVVQRLQQYATALRYMRRNIEQAQYYLMELNPRKGELMISGFKKKDLPLAEKAYEQAEGRVRRRGTDAVLVSVDSVSALERAYPNYFADTEVFRELIAQALRGRSRGIGPTRLRATETQQLELFP